MSERLAYSVPEAARLLGLAPRTAWQLVARGAWPVVRVGRRTLVRRADLEAFLAAGVARGHHEEEGAWTSTR